MRACLLWEMLIAGWLVTPLLALQGLQWAYFRGTFFEHPVLTRLDSTINFDWLTGRPAPGMPHSYYSVRWTGTRYWGVPLLRPGR